tara:strand:- start:8436 stop:8735 length:300 start_codon:yes stop_codon:yes gene_type:complete
MNPGSGLLKNLTECTLTINDKAQQMPTIDNKSEFLNELKSSVRAKQVRTALAMKGWTQRDLAEQLGVHESAVSMFINGHRNSKKFHDYLDRELGIVVSA